MAMSATVAGACGKSDPPAPQGAAGSAGSAGSAESAGSARDRAALAGSARGSAAAGPVAATGPVRIVVSLDGKELRFTIPPGEPAVLGAESWPRRIAIAASGVTAAGATLHAGVVSRGAQTGEEPVDLARLLREAPIAVAVTPGAPVAIEVARLADAFGDAPPPRALAITWTP
jgi:hypothetical protein